jgi:hypothetical protein
MVHFMSLTTNTNFCLNRLIKNKCIVKQFLDTRLSLKKKY